MARTLHSLILATGAAAALAGCATIERPAPRLAAVEVPAAGETAPVGTAAADAADDPAIWVPAPGATARFGEREIDGLILGTDKKAGLYVYDLSGAVLQFLPDGLLNNVDLVADGDGFVAAASDRGRMGVALYRFTGAGSLVSAGFIRSDVVEPYGLCMGRWHDAMLAVLVAKDGDVRVFGLSGSGTGLSGAEVGRFKIATQSEGCAIDAESGSIFVGEENRGLWRYRLDAPSAEPTMISAVGDGALVADVEGVAILQDGAHRYLLVSSQGDDAFATWRMDTGAPAYVGRFRVAASGDTDGVSGTDGIAALGGAVGQFSEGLVVVQDDANEGGPQNFKLVDWRDIRGALGIR